MDSSRWKPSKATKDANIGRQGFDLCILGCVRYFVHQLPWEKKNYQLRILYNIISAFEGRNCLKKRPQMKKKNVLFHQDNALYHKSIAMMAKLHELLPHPPYSLDLALSDYWLFANLKRMLQGKRFGSNEEVISETETYFEAKEKLFYKKGIKLLEKC